MTTLEYDKIKYGIYWRRRNEWCLWGFAATAREAFEKQCECMKAGHPTAFVIRYKD